MNGIHDLGGMDGFGPVQPEPETQEPVFHAEWEGRVYGIVRSLGRLGLWNIDKGRYARERQHPLQYLGNSYYESWLAGLCTQLVETGLVTAKELASGRAGSPSPESLRERVLRTEQVSRMSLANPDYNREAAAPPRYKAGDAVRALNRRRPGHTREPRYVLGRVGVVHEHYGAHVYADLSAQGVDEGHHLYSVRFEAEELWGDSANSNSVVYVDLFEDYLEPAELPPPSAGPLLSPFRHSREGGNRAPESPLPPAEEGSESPLPSAGEGQGGGMTDSPDLQALGAIPRDDDGPVFEEPWQAAAFAMAVRLSQEGRFTWAEWAETLSQEVAAAQQAGDPDLGDTYYLHWTRALERLCARKGLVPEADVDRRTGDWRRAYLRTPHGQPIELSPPSPGG